MADDDEDAGWSTGDLRSLTGGDGLADASAAAVVAGGAQDPMPVVATIGDDESDESAFFTITDDEMKSEIGSHARRSARSAEALAIPGRS